MGATLKRQPFDLAQGLEPVERLGREILCSESISHRQAPLDGATQTMMTSQENSKGKRDDAGQPDQSASAFSEDGVDLTLIRWMLSLSPAQRLVALQGTVQSILRLRNARPGS